MYRIKQIAEDFKVQEIKNDLTLTEKGQYSYAVLEKRGLTSLEAVEKLAKRLYIDKERIGIAGNKDKRAITRQYLSVFNVDKERLESVSHPDMKIEFLGYGDNRINLGELEGNKFEIVIRNLDAKVEGHFDYMINYFDDQRFGASLNTHIVGKALIQKKFDEACALIGLKPIGNDFIGELRTQHKHLLKMYVYAYQSYLWNRAVCELLKKRGEYFGIDYALGTLIASKNIIEGLAIPLISFDSVLSGEVKEIYDALLKEEGVSYSDFIIREMPEVVGETVYRDVFVDVKNFKILEYSKDLLNPSKFKETISFELPKGSYATMLVKLMFG